MPRYVPKEDVEKGLVDPTKPLDEQPIYKQKIEKQEKQKQPKNKEQGLDNKDNQKKWKQKRQNKHHIHKNDITLDTPIPQAPKKLYPKPDNERFYQKKNNLINKKKDLIKDKNRLKQEQKIMRQNTKNGQVQKSKYSLILKQKNNVKNQLERQFNIIQQVKNNIDKKIQSLKNKIDQLKNPHDLSNYSIEKLKQKKQYLQRKLTTADLNKKQQAQMQNQINSISRFILKGRPQIQIDTEIRRLIDQIGIQYTERNRVNVDWKDKLDQLKQAKRQIAKIMEQKKTEQTEAPLKSYQQIKSEYDAKLAKLDTEIDNIDLEIDNLRVDLDKQWDNYQEQEDLLNKIKIIKERKQQIKKEEEQRQLKKKKKLQQQEKRKKQQQKRQKEKQQRKKQAEEKKQKHQQKMLKLKNQRQIYINRNPHQNQIDACNFLISYCQMLKPENNKAEGKQQKKPQIIDQEEIKGHQWQKQFKKGAQLIVSKKIQAEDQNQKKAKKEKKKKEKDPEETGFIHNIDVINRFHRINSVVPLKLQQIDLSITQLKQKIKIFQNPSEQQIKKYKQKAGREFDQRNGLINQQKKTNYRQKHHEPLHQKHQKQHHEGENNQKKYKYKIKEESRQGDFPGLN